jgi:ABC-type nitrate/sulfonate/bicarbonate transport system ATPase subunit/flavin-dependent dehydrogenase
MRGDSGAAGPSPPDEASSLLIRDVSKSYRAPDGSTMFALDHVTLAIQAGELVSIIGPSGCGKSTLLRLIAGLDLATSGDLTVGGSRITGPSAERGLMFQDPSLFPWLTVRRNVQAGLVARGVLHERRHEVGEFIRLVGLEAFADVYPHQLSGGMAQRAALARALINHPKVLLLDEPLGALDQFTRMRMQDEVLRLWQARGTTMLLVTHDIDEAIYMSDRIVLMTPHPGRVERVIPVALERPRYRNSPGFLDLRAEILQLLHFTGSDDGESPPPAHFSQPLAPEASARPGLAAETGSGVSALDAEVIIIGGGPAGSTLGAYLSRAGIGHMILDRAVHPRRHVGESLVCSTTRLFDEIGFLPVMEREGFIHKHGANWVHWDGQRRCTLRFREIPEMSIRQDYTYHVDRARFDQLLLKHAESCGSRVLQGAQVERVEFGPNGAATGVRVQQDGSSRLLRGRLIVDASGRQTLLGSQLKLKRKDPLFNQFAVHSWFEGVDRGTADTADFIHIHLLPLPRAWAWQIPISPTVTSVGVVTDGTAFVKGGEDVEAYFARQVALNPVLAARMAAAQRLEDFQRDGNYSYMMDRFAGDGWLLVGDAARFVDPVFSSGVSVAMELARRAAEVIGTALAAGDLSAARFAPYESAVRTGVDVWRQFILLYYRLPPMFFDLLNETDSRLLALQLLQGEVFDRRPLPILDRMRQAIAVVEADPTHPWRPYLSPELADPSALS